MNEKRKVRTVNYLVALIAAVVVVIGVITVIPAIKSLFSIGISIESGTPFVLLLCGFNIAVGSWLFYKGVRCEWYKSIEE